MSAPTVDPKQPDSSPKLTAQEATRYAVGGVAQNLMGNILNQLVNPIFSDGLGLSKWVVSIGIGLPRVLDAVIDPWIGHWSDTTTCRFGRRRPFMLAGGILSAVAFILLWLPAGGFLSPVGSLLGLPASGNWGTTLLLTWFMAFTTLFYIGFSLYNIPYSAFAYEIATTGRARTNLLTYKTIILLIAAIPTSMAFSLCMCDWNALIGDGSIWERIQAAIAPAKNASKTESSHLALGGIQVVGTAIGLLILVSALGPVFCREPKTTESGKRSAFWDTIKESIRCRPFLVLNIGIILAFIGVFLVMPMAFYFKQHKINQGVLVKAGLMTSAVLIMQSIVGLVASLASAWLLNRLGSYKGMLICLAVVISSHMMTYWMYTPENPWLQLVPMAIWQLAWTGVMLAYQIMLGDCCDYDELTTGHQRQGAFAAVTAFLTKFAIGITQALAGFALTFSGIVDGAERQSATTISLLRIEYAIIPSVFIGLAFLIFLKYPLRGDQPDKIRDELHRRRASSGIEPKPAQT